MSLYYYQFKIYKYWILGIIVYKVNITGGVCSSAQSEQESHPFGVKGIGVHRKGAGPFVHVLERECVLSKVCEFAQNCSTYHS